VPGAAYLSEPVLTGLDIAFIAPGGARALIKIDGRLSISRDLSGSPASQQIAGDDACADLVAWSDDGRAAAVHCRESGSLRLLNGLDVPGSMTVTSLDTSTIVGKLNAIAVDPAGASIAAAFESSGLWMLRAGAPPALMTSLADARALAFTPSGDTLFAADRQRRQVVKVGATGLSHDLDVVATLSEDCDPTGLALATGGSRLILADGAARNVRTFDLRSKATSSETSLDISPTGLLTLVPGTVYLLNSAANEGEPLQVFNAAQAAAYFIPRAGGSK
jgi:hypothetical protein